VDTKEPAMTPTDPALLRESIAAGLRKKSEKLDARDVLLRRMLIEPEKAEGELNVNRQQIDAVDVQLRDLQDALELAERDQARASDAKRTRLSAEDRATIVRLKNESGVDLAVDADKKMAAVVEALQRMADNGRACHGFMTRALTTLHGLDNDTLPQPPDVNAGAGAEYAVFNRQRGVALLQLNDAMLAHGSRALSNHRGVADTFARFVHQCLQAIGGSYAHQQVVLHDGFIGHREGVFSLEHHARVDAAHLHVHFGDGIEDVQPIDHSRLDGPGQMSYSPEANGKAVSDRDNGAEVARKWHAAQGKINSSGE
jgi:DNA-binding NarL/FixJ family response regulator